MEFIWHGMFDGNNGLFAALHTSFLIAFWSIAKALCAESCAFNYWSIDEK